MVVYFSILRSVAVCLIICAIGLGCKRKLPVDTKHTGPTLEDVFGPQKDSEWVLVPRRPPIDSANFSGKTFKTDVDFYFTPFLTAASFDRVHFDSAVNFGKAEFHNGAGFFNSRFEKGAEFGNAKFSGYADFQHTYYFKRADFSGAQFWNGKSYFAGSGFYDYASFLGCIFDSVDFSEAEFDESDFNDAKFVNQAIFQKTKFNNNAYFNRTTFYCDVAFDRCQFKKEAQFEFCDFRGKTSFSNSIFSDSAILDFTFCKFHDTLDLSFLQGVENEINLIYSTAKADNHLDDNDSTCSLILYGSDISKIKLNYRFFKLAPIKPSGEALDIDEASSLYEQLLKNFKDHGQNESFEKLDLEYRRYQEMNGKWYGRMFGRINRGWWLYGYRKQLIFAWSALLLLLFATVTAINRNLLPFLHNEIYPMEAIQRKLDNRERPFNGFNRIWYSFVYVSALFFRLTVKVENFKFNSSPKKILGTLYIILIYTLGTVCLAYMANFVISK